VGNRRGSGRVAGSSEADRTSSSWIIANSIGAADRIGVPDGFWDWVMLWGDAICAEPVWAEPVCAVAVWAGTTIEARIDGMATTAIHPAIDRAANLSDTAFSLVRRRLPVGGVTFPSSRRTRATFWPSAVSRGKPTFLVRAGITATSETLKRTWERCPPLAPSFP
jgi:hypothetical protein